MRHPFPIRGNLHQESNVRLPEKMRVMVTADAEG